MKAQTKVQDPRCKCGPSAGNSFNPSEGRFSKDYGADQQRLQISDPHFDKLPAPATFAQVRFKTEVCTCSLLKRCVDCHVTSFVVWFSCALVKTWFYAAQRLDTRTRGLGAVHPRSPTAVSPLANGAGQPSTAGTRGPSVSETPTSSGPGWIESCSSTTPSGVQTFGGSPRPRFHSRGSPPQSHQAREGTRGDGGFSRARCGMPPFRVGVGQVGVEKTTNQHRGRGVPQVYCQIREEDHRLGRGTDPRDGVTGTGKRAIATLGNRASIRSGCATSADDPAARLANRNGCSEGQVGSHGGGARRSSARHSAQTPGSGSPGSIHPSNAHSGPAGTRRLDAGPSFGSAGCHDRGRRSASLGDHIKDGRPWCHEEVQERVARAPRVPR